MTQPDYRRRRILIWGKTRPELSKTYREIVCTGGVFEDSRRLVRLYPIPLRFLESARVFQKYQWIEADVTRNLSDPRPESHKIRYEGIVTGETIPTHKGNWDARALWVMQPDNLFESVEALKVRQQIDKTSLGIVHPARVSEITSHRTSTQEKAEFLERYREAVQQMELPLDPDTGREIRPLRPGDYRFKVHFRCDDSQCQTDHIFSVLDWEIDALYFRLHTENGQPPELAAQGVVEKLWEICGPDKDTHFFLGNIANHPQNFTIVGLWYPKKKTEDPQVTLFDRVHRAALSATQEALESTRSDIPGRGREPLGLPACS